MKKKIISFLSLLSLIVTMLPCGYAFAENTNDLDRKAAVLRALEIDSATASDVVTNEYILTALSGFLYEKEYKPSAEDFARNVGILNYGETYNGSKTVTKSEAVAYAVATLGYKEYADGMGENGYKTVASSLGITKGVNMSAETTISVNECRAMFYNMLDVSPMVATFNQGERKLIIENEHTVLSKYRKIHRVYGVLKADSVTSLDNVNGCGNGLVQIDDSLYGMNNYLPESNLLGKHIEAYVTTDTDYEPEILYLGEREGKNEEIEINARDIKEISADYSTLEYYTDSQLKRAKIAEVPRVIYNGVFYGNYAVSDFKPEAGKLRLVDNNNDRKYDIIFISSYETVIVSAVDMHEKTIYNRFISTGNLASVSLEPDLYDVKYTISDGMNEIDFSEIKTSDVLSVARSKASDNLVIEILVCRETVAGMLQNVDEQELEIYIGDEVYPITSAFLRFKNEEGNVNLGSTYTFYYDALENVVFWEQISKDGYAVLRKAYLGEDGVSSYVSYMNLDGVWIDAPVARRLRIDETLYKDYEISYETLKNIKGQLVKLEFDSEGEIRKIETATETSNFDENQFTKTPTGQYTWRSGVSGFSDTSTGKIKYYVEDDAKLIVIPQDYSYKAGYEVSSPIGFFHGDTNYRISMYDIDEFGFSKIVVMQYEPQIRNALFVVTGKTKAAVDGEVHCRLKGNAGDFENITLTGYDDTIFDTVNKGDIIKASLNAEGYVDDYELVFSLTNFSDKRGTQYTSQSYMAGKVSAIDAAKGRIKIVVNGEEYTFRINNNVSVQIYNEQSEIETSSIYSIIPGKNVFVDISWGNVRYMIIKQ